MKLFEFEKHFPDEESCRMKFKEIRDKEGVVCPKCGCREHVWLSGHKQYQCRHCRHRIGLRAGTIMHASKLPFRYWFIAMHLLTATKHTFSASELQRQLGHKRYQPIWEMLHKLRSVMGKRDGKYILSGNIELDEGFFTTEVPDEQKTEKLKAGAGSQRKTKVIVMAESTEEIHPKASQKPKKVGHIKMIVVPDTLASTIDRVASETIAADSRIITDAGSSHIHLKELFTEHKSQVINPKDIGKVLPWVHIAIANAKTLLADIYHGIRPDYLQEYLNEYCYKFNRRYFGEDLFERILLTSVGCRADFEHTEKIQPDMKHEFDTLEDMLKEISPYITARALARICGINESQMLQYKSGHQKITPRTIVLINERLSIFAEELKQLKLNGA